MSSIRSRLSAAALVAAASSAAVLPACAFATSGDAPSSSPPQSSRGVVRTDVRIQRFAVQGHRVVAKGTARVGLRDSGGQASTASKPVTFAVSGGGKSATCRVLTLKLDTLQLTLLGLRVDTSAINLMITGDQKGGALGQLFCRLSKGIRLNNKVLSRRAARSLNRRLSGRPMRAIGFSANVRTSTTPSSASSPSARAAQAPPPAGSCQVLDLILGPLNLDLLGLRVDLYGASTTSPVRVLITADPNGGVLGQVFCRLASGQSASG